MCTSLQNIFKTFIFQKLVVSNQFIGKKRNNQTNSHANKPKDSHPRTQSDWQTEIKTSRQTGRQTNKQTPIHPSIHPSILTDIHRARDRQTDSQTYRPIDRQTDGHTNRQTDNATVWYVHRLTHPIFGRSSIDGLLPGSPSLAESGCRSSGRGCWSGCLPVPNVHGHLTGASGFVPSVIPGSRFPGVHAVLIAVAPTVRVGVHHHEIIRHARHLRGWKSGGENV
jgi:hypothetical protein